jgi:LysR family hydrogen peroxide-inducible transcriptional activator
MCFLPEHLGIVPGLRMRPLADPEVIRTISLVTVAGRRHTPAVARFMREAAAYAWPDTPDAEASAPRPEPVRKTTERCLELSDSH